MSELVSVGLVLSLLWVFGFLLIPDSSALFQVMIVALVCILIVEWMRGPKIPWISLLEKPVEKLLRR